LSNQAKERDLRDVMEVLDIANENQKGDDGEHGGTDSSDSENDGTHDQDGRPQRVRSELEDDKNGHEGKPHGILGKAKALVEGHNDSNDGKRDVLSELRDYKDHLKQLHRRHRGLMQFKAVRTMDWLVTKARHEEGHFSNMIEREPGIETETRG
jgi:hypothetical protein